MNMSFLARLRPKLKRFQRVVNTLRIVREKRRIEKNIHCDEDDESDYQPDCQRGWATDPPKEVARVFVASRTADPIPFSPSAAAAYRAFFEPAIDSSEYKGDHEHRSRDHGRLFGGKK